MLFPDFIPSMSEWGALFFSVIICSKGLGRRIKRRTASYAEVRAVL